MKKLIIALLGIIMSAVAYCQTDFEIAQEFMNEKGVVLSNISKTRGNTEPYSVFNGEDGKGFAIVVNGSVVGYSVDGTIGEIPKPLKDILDTSTRLEGKNYPDEFKPRNVTPIEPLIKTKWGQDYPYNDMCPVKDGRKCLTGCTATAMAQILYYYRLPYGCKRFDGKYSNKKDDIKELPATEFDWDNMLLEYRGNGYTKDNVNAIAKLMYYCGALGHSEYGIDITWGNINPCRNTKGEEIFSMYLNYDGCDYYNTDNYPDKEMVKVMDKALEKKEPILILGRPAGNGGHWYIVDGRDSDGLFHVNWGYRGDSDGYFILSTELFAKYGPRNSVGYYCRHLDLIIPHGTLEYTAINGVGKHAIDDNRVYNLQGQIVDSPKRGIYIKNGRKIIIR